MRGYQKKKRYHILWYFLIYLLVGAVGGISFGYLFMKDLTLKGNLILRLLMGVGTVFCAYLAVFLERIVHEAGHYFFGRITGYKLASFRMGKLVIVRDRGKLKLKKYVSAGNGGECIMVPPENDDCDYSYRWYLFGGCIADFIAAVICLAIYIAEPDLHTLGKIFLDVAIIAGFSFSLLNGIPISIGNVENDGYLAVWLNRDETARRAFWFRMKINGEFASGTRLKDMPFGWFELPEDADLTNSQLCILGIWQSGYFRDRHEFDKAEQISSRIENAPGLPDGYKYELRCELLYYEVVRTCSDSEISRLYTWQLQQYIRQNARHLSKLRLMQAYVLFTERDDVGARRLFAEFKLIARHYPYSAEIESEKELFEMVESIARQLSIGYWLR